MDHRAEQSLLGSPPLTPRTGSARSVSRRQRRAGPRLHRQVSDRGHPRVLLLAPDPSVCDLDSARLLLFRGRLGPGYRKGDEAPVGLDSEARRGGRSPSRSIGTMSSTGTGARRAKEQTTPISSVPSSRRWIGHIGRRERRQLCAPARYGSSSRPAGPRESRSSRHERDPDGRPARMGWRTMVEAIAAAGLSRPSGSSPPYPSGPIGLSGPLCGDRTACALLPSRFLQLSAGRSPPGSSARFD